MGCVPAPACKQALNEATQRWPKRSRASDGICASATHSSQNSSSDHERGEAFDLTHNPENGCDAHYMVRELAERRDPRVKYIISQGQIWNPSISYAWRAYNGSNPHNKHAHVSIRPHVRNDTSPWWPKPKPEPQPEPPKRKTRSRPEEDMIQATRRAENFEGHPVYDLLWATANGGTSGTERWSSHLLVRCPQGDTKVDIYFNGGQEKVIRDVGMRTLAEPVALDGICSVVSLNDAELEVALDRFLYLP